jgi:hypothetical protein
MITSIAGLVNSRTSKLGFEMAGCNVRKYTKPCPHFKQPDIVGVKLEL